MNRREFCIGALSTALILQRDLLAQTVDGDRHPVKAIQDTETLAQRNARMAWWRAARFGMFIHWGLYSTLGGIWNGKREADHHSGEWIMNWDKIPVADYENLAKRFNPTQFNAEQWVAMAKASGMKYIIITAKHHEGFAMFDSKVNKFNIVDATPFKRDPLKELAIACQKQGIKLGFYYSQAQDWTFPGGAAAHGHWDKAQNGSFAEYLHNKAIPQIEELLTNYQQWGAPVEMWFDTPIDMTPQLAGEIVKVMNKHPNVIWDNRLGGGYEGDFLTPEQIIPPHGYPGQDWETHMTINNTWGYKSYDTDFKSVKTLLQDLIDVVSLGGNYMVNVGPDPTGVIPKQERDQLLAIGRWLEVNGDAIYGTHEGPFGHQPGCYSATEKDWRGDPLWVPGWDWRATAKPGKVYVSIFEWPHSEFSLPPLQARVTKAYMLADSRHRSLNFTQEQRSIKVALPPKAPDPIASVLVLDTVAGD